MIVTELGSVHCILLTFSLQRGYTHLPVYTFWSELFTSEGKVTDLSAGGVVRQTPKEAARSAATVLHTSAL